MLSQIRYDPTPLFKYLEDEPIEDSDIVNHPDFERLVNREIKERLEKCLLADPDPYGYHGLSFESRMRRIEHFIETGLFT